MDNISIDTLCAVYVKMRSKKQEIQKEADARVAEIEAQMSNISAAIKDRLVEAGGQSIKTSHGTAYLTQKTRYYPTDWSGFSEWVIKNNAVDLLEKRISQANMTQWLKECPTNPPVGVHGDTEVTVVVRKS
jgi:hypothetical protein